MTPESPAQTGAQIDAEADAQPDAHTDSEAEGAGVVDGLQIIGITGLKEINAGDNLIEICAAALRNCRWPDGSYGMRSGDVIVISSKIVAKSQGRLRPAHQFEQALAAQTAAVVAQRPVTPSAQSGSGLRIVRTHDGVVLANAGIDLSNIGHGQLVLLPAQPDAAAQALRAGLQRSLACENLGVLITDTAGRAWREGVHQITLGAAGVRVLADLRGSLDHLQRPLQATVVAVADEIANAAELVCPKNAATPVAVVRGLSEHPYRIIADASEADRSQPGTTPSPLTAAALVRSPERDLFSLGTAEAMAVGQQSAVAQRRTVRRFDNKRTVPGQLIESAMAAAITAPSPHHSRPWRFIWTKEATRRRVLTAMAHKWQSDLAEIDGFSPDQISRRIARGDILWQAPEVIFAGFDYAAGPHTYPDARRNCCERDMFIAAGGAAVQSFLIQAAALGLGTAWISGSFFCAETVRIELGLPTSWQPLGVIAAGFPANPSDPRPQLDLAPYLQRR